MTRVAGGLDNGVTAAYNWNNPFPIAFPATYPVIDPTLDNGQGIGLWSRFDNKPFRIVNTSFEIGRELPGQVSLKATYIGTFGHGLVVASPYDLNAPPLSALSLGNLLTENINSPDARAAGIPIPSPTQGTIVPLRKRCGRIHNTRASSASSARLEIRCITASRSTCRSVSGRA